MISSTDPKSASVGATASRRPLAVVIAELGARILRREMLMFCKVAAGRWPGDDGAVVHRVDDFNATGSTASNQHDGSSWVPARLLIT
jgi:hypothetical protein